MNSKLINLGASIIALLILSFIVSGAIFWASNSGNNQSDLIWANLIFGAMAIIVWSKFLPSTKDRILGPFEWIGIFFGSAIISWIFILIDCGGTLPIFHPEFVCNGHPGLSAIFTFSAVCMTAIAIPSAIRSWIINRFGREG